MASQLGTVLPPRSPAWFWVVVTGLPALYFLWRGNGILAALFALAATLIILRPRLRGKEYETVQVDDVGVLRVVGEVREQVHWNDIDEIKIVTTSDGPWAEDVFFVLVAEKMVIKAMGCTCNSSFLIWKKGNHAA